MTKITFIIITLFTVSITFSQNDDNRTYFNANDSINKWSIEIAAGQSTGLNPYSDGYYSTSPNQFFGSPQINSFNLGFRRMFSPMFGLKGKFGYEIIKPSPNSQSLPFEMQVSSFGLETVVNASRLFKMDDVLGRWGLLLHGGFIVERMTSKTENSIFSPLDHGKDLTEYNGGVVLGATPQYRISNKLALFFDLAFVNNFRQHLAWDGAYSESKNNLSGQLISATFGISFSLGVKNSTHGDWIILEDPNLVQIKALGLRIDEMEKLMNDSDKDGVPDYLDAEPNSIAGVDVDTKGRMTDINKNGVPDALERHLNANYAGIDSIKNQNSAENLINDGYVATYFDTNKSTPTNVSTEGIDFILSFLRNNPTKGMDIIGHADEIGANEKNDTLASKRAESVKSILIKAGIDTLRLNVITNGEDNSVDVTSDGARKLVRRVTFKVKN